MLSRDILKNFLRFIHSFHGIFYFLASVGSDFIGHFIEYLAFYFHHFADDRGLPPERAAVSGWSKVLRGLVTGAALYNRDQILYWAVPTFPRRYR